MLFNLIWLVVHQKKYSMNKKKHFYVEIEENEAEATSQANPIQSNLIQVDSIRIDHQYMIFELLLLLYLTSSVNT